MVKVSKAAMTRLGLIGALAVSGVGVGGGHVSAAGKGAPAANYSVPLGAFCSAQCKVALTLHHAPASISCNVGFALDATSFPYGATMGTKTAAVARQYFPHMQMTVLDGRNDAAVQTTNVDTLISKGIKVLIINAVQRQALVSAVQRAEKAGVKVVAVDRAVNASVLTTIKADDFTTGQVAGQFLVKSLHGKGNVVELSGSAGASPTVDRHAGFMSVLSRYPGIHIITSLAANYDRSQALTVMGDILQRFPSGKIDAVFTHNDEMSLGAIQAIKSAHRQKEMIVVGIDGQDSAIKAIENGDYTATAVYPIAAPEGVVAAAKACVGEPLPQRITLDAPLVTKANARMYLGANFAG